MRVTVYNASWSTLGGGEKYGCVIADTLGAAGHHVELLVHHEEITRSRLQSYYNIALENVEVRRCGRRDVRTALRTADLAFIISNFRPLGTPAGKTVYVLQIPYPPITLPRIMGKMVRGEPREGVKDILRVRLLRDARSASAVLVYSDFVRDCLLRNHDIRATVLYPPIDDFNGGGPKERAILSVGRIFRGLYNDKRYDVMIDAFRRLVDRGGVAGWEYWIAGSCGTDVASQQYLQELREAAAGYPIRFFVNAPYAELRGLYARADLFWHAAGYGVDDRREPQRTEHFGMSTVEAMSASCIPVVVNNGGQREIVTHGVNGFLWDTIDQLVDHTRLLITKASEHGPIRAEARMRYGDFDRTHFAERLHHIVHSLGVNP